MWLIGWVADAGSPAWLGVAGFAFTIDLSHLTPRHPLSPLSQGVWAGAGGSLRVAAGGASVRPPHQQRGQGGGGGEAHTGELLRMRGCLVCNIVYVIATHQQGWW